MNKKIRREIGKCFDILNKSNIDNYLLGKVNRLIGDIYNHIIPIKQDGCHDIIDTYDELAWVEKVQRGEILFMCYTKLLYSHREYSNNETCSSIIVLRAMRILYYNL